MGEEQPRPPLSELDQEALRNTWERQRIWSLSATGLRQRIDRARRITLILAVATAILAVAAGQMAGLPTPWGEAPGWGKLLNFLAALTAGVGAWFARRTELGGIRTWTTVRAVAEGLKSEIYQCLAGGVAYLGAEAGQVLTQRCHLLLQEAHREDPGLERVTLGVTADDKPLPAVRDGASYIEKRVNDQINWYRGRAKDYEQRVRALRALIEVLGLLAVVASAAGAFLGRQGVAAWVPVITTITTAVVAHVSASRYEEQVADFLRTARDLESLRHTRRSQAMGDAAFIEACEALLATENRAWRIGWTSPPGQAPGQPPGQSPDQPSDAAGEAKQPAG
jgi:hypothetical protein